MELTQEEKRFMEIVHNTPERELEERFTKAGLSTEQIEEAKRILNS